MFPSRPVRLAILPLAVTVMIAVIALLMVLLIAGLITAAFDRRRRLIRIASFGLVYLTMEMVVLVRGFAAWLRHRRNDRGWEAANDRTLMWALGMALGAARRCLGFTVEIEPGPCEESFAHDAPVLVLARHGGPGDSFSLAYLIEAVYGRKIRIVAKDILQLDPAIDLLLNRRGCCFVGSSSGRGLGSSQRLATCTVGLGHDDALLLFPEGENWTPRRRSRAIQRLRDRRRHRAANAAEQMENVLPPRPSGVGACLAARPGLAVVVAAHSGLDRIVSARQLWRAIPFTTPMTVRFRAVSAPLEQNEEAVAEWLTSEWAEVDRWIAAQHERDGAGERDAAGRLVGKIENQKS